MGEIPRGLFGEKIFRGILSAALFFSFLQAAAAQDVGRGPADFLSSPVKQLSTATIMAADETMTFFVPAGWTKIRNDEAGILLVAQRDPSGVRPFISAVFYGRDNSEFKDAKAYIDRYHEPELVERDWVKTGPDEAFKVGDRPARRFLEDGVDQVPPGSMNSREIPVREEHVLLPYSGGFYSFVFKAPTGAFEKLRPAFQKVLDAFKPLPAVNGAKSQKEASR